MSLRNETRRCLGIFKTEYADTCCRIGEVLLAFSSGLLTVATFGTSFWLEAKDKDNSYHQGLWQNCSDFSTNGCRTLPLNGPSYLISARFFMCLALIGGVMAWIISIIGLLQHRSRWLFAATVAYGVQALTMVLGLGSFGKAFSHGTKTTNLSSGWSYNVGWLAMVLALMCALYFFSVAWYRHRHPANFNVDRETRSYAPLAQFESAETSSDYDDDNYL